MISTIKIFLDWSIKLLIDIEETNQSVVKLFKQNAISILGPLINATLLMAAPLALAADVNLVSIAYSIAIIISGSLFFSAILLIGAWWTWEFLRYDLRSKLNPLYYRN